MLSLVLVLSQLVLLLGVFVLLFLLFIIVFHHLHVNLTLAPHDIFLKGKCLLLVHSGNLAPQAFSLSPDMRQLLLLPLLASFPLSLLLISLVTVHPHHVDSQLSKEQVLLLHSFQQVLLVLLPPLLGLHYFLPHFQLRSDFARSLLHNLLLLVQTLSQPRLLVNFHALLDDLAELLNLVNCLLILLLHLLHYLQRPVLLAKHLVHFLSVPLLELHAIVSSARALYMERNCAPRRLALHACSVLLQADDALKREPLIVKLVQPHRCLGSNKGAGDERRTTNVYPLIQGLCVRVVRRFKSGLILLEEVVVVLRDLGLLLVLVVVEFNLVSHFGVVAVAQLVLIVDLSFQYHSQTQTLVFSR